MTSNIFDIDVKYIRRTQLNVNNTEFMMYKQAERRSLNVGLFKQHTTKGYKAFEQLDEETCHVTNQRGFNQEV